MYNWVAFSVPETNTTLVINFKIEIKDFPGRPVVKNTPADAENVGLISGLGRLRMLRATTSGPASPERMRYPLLWSLPAAPSFLSAVIFYWPSL